MTLTVADFESAAPAGRGEQAVASTVHANSATIKRAISGTGIAP